MCVHRLDCVRTKVWVALFGVVSAGMAVLASFGLLLFCGMPFAMTVGSAPFLILGKLHYLIFYRCVSQLVFTSSAFLQVSVLMTCS